MVSLFLACHDQYLIMFKDLNVFESFQTKYNNTAVFSVSSNYLFSRRKQEKILLKQFFEYIYCIFINIPPKLNNF